METRINMRRRSATIIREILQNKKTSSLTFTHLFRKKNCEIWNVEKCARNNLKNMGNKLSDTNDPSKDKRTLYARKYYYNSN